MAGETYTFTTLDSSGEPIPGLRSTDVWVGVEAPDPPTNVKAKVTNKGIKVTWAPVPIVPKSFKPTSGLGQYEIGSWEEQVTTSTGLRPVYYSGGLKKTSHLIPKDQKGFIGQAAGLSLGELLDGIYGIIMNIVSSAPQGSAGHGQEYLRRDS